jgi:hypothetical protein
MSKKEVEYRQCSMKRENSTQVAWIPTKYAKIGMILEIEGIEGWEVISAGQTVLDGRAVKVLEKSARNHRKHSDI